jgi:hypothetical protein
VVGVRTLGGKVKQVRLELSDELWEALQAIALQERRDLGRTFWQGSISGILRRLAYNFAKSRHANLDQKEPSS